MSVDFYIYLNVPNNKALLHQADCQHCNSGMGRAPIKSNYNGEWIGPFDQPTARSKARQSGKNRIQWCAYCANGLSIFRDDV